MYRHISGIDIIIALIAIGGLITFKFLLLRHFRVTSSDTCGNSLDNVAAPRNQLKRNRDIIEKVNGAKRYTEYINRQVQYLKDHGIRVSGTVIHSEEISNEDRDIGNKVTIRFLTKSGVEHLVEVSSWLHWPTTEKWNEYVEQRKAGSEVTVRYRPDLDAVSKSKLGQFEDYLIEFGGNHSIV